MKKIVTFLAFITTISVSFAATITVSNDLNSPGQYTDLQLAIDATTTLSGDTILVAGSQTSYGNITINNKALHLVGIGYSPDKQAPFKAELQSCNFVSLFSPFSSSGSSIEGFDLGSISIIGQTGSYVNNITIKRCRFGTLSLGGRSSNTLIYNNIFSIIQNGGNYISTVVVANNVIDGSGIQYTSVGSPNYVYPIEIKNNLFIGSSTVSSTDNGNYSNNMFFGASPNNYHNYCNFQNNLSFASSNNSFNVTGTNNGSGNIVGQNPLIVSSVNYYYEETDDYHFPSTSPAYNAGTDGTDIGIYGGAFPWPDGGTSGSGFMYSQEPQYPQVNQMNISNSTIPVGGTLNVTSTGIVNH